MNPVEQYVQELRDIHLTGGGVEEVSYYPALGNLLNEIGKSLKPRVLCVMNTRNLGAGLPDGGLFTRDQCLNDQAKADAILAGQLPARGVIEAKSVAEDVHAVAAGEQVARYLDRYGLVLVTTFREFVLVGRDAGGRAATLESCSLAPDEASFRQAAAQPRTLAAAHGDRLIEFLKRALLHKAPLTSPSDVAWFLASYAREALARVEQRRDLPALAAVRQALEEALGMKFTGDRGEHFFRSTLVQTIFYGVFSGWVLWHRENLGRPGAFDWRLAEWSLRVPIIRALYEQVATPGQLGPLGLVEILNWTADTLNRVDRAEFFRQFQDEHAVQYFYEPFLAAFDPDLRKQLGVWYTPPEIVRYQVARVDTVLREELGLPDGLADPNVVVLDPCCGTGAYLVEVLRKIAETLKAKGGGALVGADLKRAAKERVFGFEILPAPFVVAHLQIGLMLHTQGAPLNQHGRERVGVYLTNALTGWEPLAHPKTLLFPELAAERDAAEKVKHTASILVVLGNPPYNAFAGVSPEEEKGLVEPYKNGLNAPVAGGGWGIKKFNLDDLYVRFFRLAERRIAEMTGRGVVSFISNHSWISEPSFVVLRKHLLDSFDRFWIENLHGNRKTSEYAPDGKTSETVFAQRGTSVGIQQGVATSLWVKTGKPRKKPATVRFRDDIDAARAEARRRQLLDTLEAKPKRFNAAYAQADPRPENRFSFRPEEVTAQYTQWPKMVDFCAVAPSNGLMEKRGGALIDIDRDALEARMRDYFNRGLSWEEYRARQTALTEKTRWFDGPSARAKAQRVESFQADRVVRYALRPFDTRWAYYTGVNPVWNRARPALWAQCWQGNRFVVARFRSSSDREGHPMAFASALLDDHYVMPDAVAIPIRLRNGERLSERDHATLFDVLGARPSARRPTANLSKTARTYLAGLGIEDPDADVQTAGLIWLHALAIGYSPAYLAENADGIRRDWPRIPLPASRKALEASAALGEQVAALLDTEAGVAGVTEGRIAPLFRTIGLPSRVGGGSFDTNAGDLAVTAGWGHAGKEGVTMPGKGRIEERGYEPEELAAMGEPGAARKRVLQLLGKTTRDVYLNEKACWRNVPANVWDYTIGGYQVMKKWLSYRELELLGRPLTADEAREVTTMARRMAAILLLHPALDANYDRVKTGAYPWPGSNG